MVCVLNLPTAFIKQIILMKNITNIIEQINWQNVTGSMNEKGYALVKNVLDAAACEELIAGYNNDELYRKTTIMERHGYGRGEYKYFKYPLPGLLQSLRQNIYPNLAPIANCWMEALKMEKRFPENFEELQQTCYQNNQVKPTVLILKYVAGGYNAMHQDLYGDIFFPIQLVLFLNEPHQDYTGGEFVLTEQIPRAQSKAIVLQPHKGDMLLFTTNFRAGKSSKGHRRVNMRHGVSELHSGERHTVGIIFHDAQ
jgi:hypothetical protein